METDIMALVLAVVAALISGFTTIYVNRKNTEFGRIKHDLDAAVRLSLVDREAEHKKEMLKLQNELEEERLRATAERKAKEPILHKMEQLVDMMGRVKTSTERFTIMSPSLEGEIMVEQATHTFAIIADFFAKTSDHVLLIFPVDANAALRQVKRELTQYFSMIDLRPLSQRFTNSDLPVAQTNLNQQIGMADSVMRRYLAPPSWQNDPTPNTKA